MELSKEDLEFIQNNDGVQEIIESYIPFYKKYFCFSDAEIEVLMARLISTHDQDLILNLLELYENFVNENSEISDLDERKRFAKKAVNLSIDFYSQEQESALKEFTQILKEAKAMGIDPIKLVNKTTLSKASFDSFNRCIDALQNELYTDPILKTKFSLIDSSDETDSGLASFIEQCTTVICKLNKENVQEVVDMLAEFFYDKETDSYIMRAEDAVKQVKTLLTINPEKLKDNMQYFEHLFASPSIEPSQIKRAVARCPSSLLISQNNLNGFLRAFKSNLSEIINKANQSNEKLTAIELMQMFKSKVQITDEDISKSTKTYQDFIDDVSKTFCLENLGNIYTLHSENINEMSRFNQIFIRPFGIKNTISCLQDFNFLSTDPDLLDYIFTIAQESERAGHKNLRDFILRHSARSVKLAKEIKSKPNESKPDDFAKQLTEIPKRKRTLYALPKISDDPADLERRKQRLTSSQIKTAEKLLEQIIMESRDSKDLDIELIEKLDNSPEGLNALLTILERAKTAFLYKKDEKNISETVKIMEDFIYTYKNYLLSLTKVTRAYEQAKIYYEEKRVVPLKAISSFDSVDGSSISDCLQVMEERSDQIFQDRAVISKAYKNICASYAKLLKNPYVDKDQYDEQITSLLGEDRTIIKIEAAAYTFIRRIISKLEKIYPEKSMEIIGEENYDDYLNSPFASAHLIMYMLLIGFKNSNFLYIVRKANDFDRIPTPTFAMRKTHPKEYHSQLKQHTFEESYLEIERIFDYNLTNFHENKGSKQFVVSSNNRSITTNGVTLVCPKVNENDVDEDADEALADSKEYCDVFSLDANGIIKMMGLTPDEIEFIHDYIDPSDPSEFGE